MPILILDAEAGQLSAELAQRGVAAETRVHVTVEIVDELPLATLIQQGGAFGWLSQESDLYSDKDLLSQPK